MMSGNQAACRQWLGLLLMALSLSATAGGRPDAGLLAVIIDDLGFRAAEDQAVLELDHRITVAIIPNAPLAARVSAIAKTQQRAVLVHLPLGQAPAGECDAPVCPQREWSAERMRRHLDWAFSQVEGAVGLSNHQGSLFTADTGATRRLLEGLALFSRERPRPPLVIDSRTTPSSKLNELAGSAGFRSARRDVFLDHDRAPAAMARAWDAAIAIAQRDGRVLVIGHPHPETIAFLNGALPALADSGVELVPVSEVVRTPDRSARGVGYPAAAASYRSPIEPSAP